MLPRNDLSLRWWTLVGAVSFLHYFSRLVYREVRRPEAPAPAIELARNLIARVVRGSPTDRAGLRPGETLVRSTDGRFERSSPERVKAGVVLAHSNVRTVSACRTAGTMAAAAEALAGERQADLKGRPV